MTQISIKRLRLIGLLLIAYNGSYAEDIIQASKNCRLWIEFAKVGESYNVINASDQPINSGNVLQASFINGDVADLMVPPTGGCSTKTDKNNKASCEGDFVTTNSIKNAGKNLLAFVGTLGTYQLTEGYGYTTEPNLENIKLAETTSNYKNSPITEKYINNCRNYYINDRKLAESIELERIRKAELEKKSLEMQQRENEIARQKYEANEKIYEQKFRTQLKQSSETNCGTVVELKGKMVLVQTGGDAGAVWFNKDYIAPIYDINNNVIACRDNNRIYKNENGWVLIHR